MDGTRCIILCAGEDSRWQVHGGFARKHFLEIDDEALLTRTLRLLGERPDRRDLAVTVVVRRGDEALYEPYLTVGASLFVVEPGSHHMTEAYKYLSSRDLWERDGRTVVLLGDVWYSEPALGAILMADAGEWCAFGRAEASALTRKPHGEIFALAFTGPGRHARALERLDRMYRNGECQRPAAGWALYQLVAGGHPHVHAVGEHFVEIDDFTEDFDSGRDVAAWLAARRDWIDAIDAIDRQVEAAGAG